MNASEMGKIGGRSRSEKKRTASRENGKKGGRPKRSAPLLDKVTEKPSN